MARLDDYSLGELIIYVRQDISGLSELPYSTEYDQKIMLRDMKKIKKSLNDCINKLIDELTQI